MREGWRQKTIGDVCDVINGGTPKTNVAAFWGGDHMWITPAEMGKRKTPYIAETERRLTDAGLAATNLLPPYSVILSSRAPIGHLVINTVPMGTNQGCKGLVPKPALDHKFLFYYLSSIVDLLNELGTGTTFKELSGSNLKKVPIPIPPLPEQRRTVAILDETFEAIATATANAEKNLEDSRLIFSGVLDRLFEARGEAWTEAPLGEHVRFIDYRGKTPTKAPNGIRLITAKNVKMGFVQREPEEFIDQKTFADHMTRGFPKKDDVLFTTEAPLGNVAQIDTDEVVAVGQRLITMQPDEAVLDRTFLKYLLLSAPAQREIHRRATGATVLGIKARLLKAVPISFPRSLKRQREIVKYVNQIRSEVTALEAGYRRKLELLDQLKSSILQGAYSARLIGACCQTAQEAAE